MSSFQCFIFFFERMNKEELTFLHHFIFEFTAPGIAPFFGILHSLGKDYKKSTIRPSDILETRMVVLLYSTRKKMRNIRTRLDMVHGIPV